MPPIGSSFGVAGTTEVINETVTAKVTVLAATTGALPANTYANGVNGVGATLTANVNGILPNIDGITTTVGARILVKDEPGLENGYYDVTDLGSAGTKWILTRSDDADISSEIDNNSNVWISQGTLYSDQTFILTTDGVITVGTTVLTFEIPSKSLTELGIRSTGSGVFDLKFVNVEDLTASRTLTIKLNDTNRILDLAANVSLDQNLLITSSPTFVGATLSGLTQGSIPFVGAGGLISQDNANLFWDSTNNRVGFGTTNPLTPLHVQGAGHTKIIAESPDGFDAGLNFFKGGVLKWIVDNRGNLSDRFEIRNAATTAMMVIEQGGNTGIGTVAPDAKFHVVGSIKMVDGNQVAGRVLTSDANGVGSWAAASNGTIGGTVATGGQVAFSSALDTVASDANFVWDNTNERLGIGLTTPSFPLHISQSFAGEMPARIKNTLAGSVRGAFWQVENDGGTIGSFGIGSSTYGGNVLPDRVALISASASAGLSFLAKGTGDMKWFTTDTETLRATFTTEGNLSIGTAGTTTVRLFVNGDGVSANTAFGVNSGGSNLFFIKNTGLIAIGHAVPSEKLHVEGGNIRVSGVYKVAANQVLGARKTGWATATGTATRTTFATGSVTLPELAERVKAMIDDLHQTAGHGMIGT